MSHHDVAKPRYRGRMHSIAVWVSIPFGVLLVIAAQGMVAKVSAAIAAASATGLLGASAAYHTIPWSEKNLARMKILDHSMIYVLIAGTYTPFLLLVVGGAKGLWLLALLWAGAALGIALKVIHVHGFKILNGILYITLGWVGILTLPEMLDHLAPWQLGLIVLGGVIYTAGAVVLLRNKPDPNPEVFGYHEIWHTAVVLGVVCYYVVLLSIVTSPPAL